MTERRRWNREDEILILDAYFCAQSAHQQDPNIQLARELIDLPANLFYKKLAQIRHLNLLDVRSAAAERVAAQTREVWAEYCQDNKWMLWQLKQEPGCDFRLACRDLTRLRRDAQKIIIRRTPPQSVSRREVRLASMKMLFAAGVQNISAADSLLQLREDADSGSGTARGQSALSDSMLDALAACADQHREDMDSRIADASGRPPERISAVELALLRSALAELLSFSTAPEVVIDESVEIAKQFGAEGGHKIVNAALDKIAGQLKHARK